MEYKNSAFKPAYQVRVKTIHLREVKSERI